MSSANLSPNGFASPSPQCVDSGPIPRSVPGGFRVQEDARMCQAHLTSALQQIQKLDGITIAEPYTMTSCLSQVVAGTNWYFTLEKKGAEGATVCVAVRSFEPLPSDKEMKGHAEVQISTPGYF